MKAAAARGDGAGWMGVAARAALESVHGRAAEDGVVHLTAGDTVCQGRVAGRCRVAGRGQLVGWARTVVD